MCSYKEDMVRRAQEQLEVGLAQIATASPFRQRLLTKATALKLYYFDPFLSTTDVGGAPGASAERIWTTRQIAHALGRSQSMIARCIKAHANLASDIPGMTLDELADVLREDPIQGQGYVFTVPEEQELVEFVKRCCLGAVSLSKTEFTRYVLAASKVPRPDGVERRQFEHDKVSDKWVNDFVARHSSQIGWRSSSVLETLRVAALSEKKLGSLFALLAEYSNLYPTLFATPANIFNMDESDCSVGRKKKRALAAVGVKRVSRRSGRTITMGPHVTGLFTVCADGTAPVAPHFIVAHPRPTLPHRCTEGLDEELIHQSESGFINEEIFDKWFRDFVEVVKERATTTPVLLVMDGSSCHKFTVGLIDLAVSNNILVAILPSHTSTHLQPLDVTVFAWYKNLLETHVQSILDEDSPLIDVNIKLHGAIRAWNEIDDRSNLIRSGFRQTGIYPLDTEKHKTLALPSVADVAVSTTPSLHIPEPPPTPDARYSALYRVRQIADAALVTIGCTPRALQQKRVHDAAVADLHRNLEVELSVQEVLRAPPRPLRSRSIGNSSMRVSMNSTARSPLTPENRDAQLKRQELQEKRKQLEPLKEEYNRQRPIFLRTLKDLDSRILTLAETILALETQLAALGEEVEQDIESATAAETRNKLAAARLQHTKLVRDRATFFKNRLKRPTLLSLEPAATASTPLVPRRVSRPRPILASQSMANDTVDLDQSASEEESESDDDDDENQASSEMASAAIGHNDNQEDPSDVQRQPQAARKRRQEDDDENVAPVFTTVTSDSSDVVQVDYQLSSTELQEIRRYRMPTRSTTKQDGHNVKLARVDLQPASSRPALSDLTNLSRSNTLPL
ncbi:hypothetical protein CAOG_09176 [Capsaspora owczarzaki ATCC 30864]|uniref:hypothetical protein n=1 Tax=Capsaspora owczarzaki (strain ATCC 30864) TaxID=595528 RepID=UPI00035225DC|nr:hypothetical protein CAOG_09176 [Capsaspora owczarzaki ATCC 30864]|eukprot:XP_011270892.1 hypothetical protein CAOG_09176 [Capsaspora owczarzaki ATCC 30864]